MNNIHNKYQPVVSPLPNASHPKHFLKKNCILFLWNICVTSKLRIHEIDLIDRFWRRHSWMNFPFPRFYTLVGSTCYGCTQETLATTYKLNMYLKIPMKFESFIFTTTKIYFRKSKTRNMDFSVISKAASLMAQIMNWIFSIWILNRVKMLKQCLLQYSKDTCRWFDLKKIYFAFKLKKNSWKIF